MTVAPVQILIIDQDATERELIKSVLAHQQQYQVIADTDSLVYGYEIIRQNHPQVVFVDLKDDGGKTLEIISRISTFFKDILIIVSGSGEFMTMEGLMACMQAGAREFLQRPMLPQQILDTLSKHYSSLTIEGNADATGRLLTIFSNKGGLGKTTVAVNLAVALSQVIKKPVVLVDLNLQLGDITTFLDIEPKQTIVDIAKDIGRVDATYLENSLAEYVTHDGTDEAKVYILADPLNMEEAEEVSAEQINAVLTVLRASFPYVIVDTNTSFDSKTLTALDLADDILLVSIVNLPCIRSSQRLLSLFNRLGYDPDKIKLIVNRFVEGEEIGIEDVEDTLEHPVFWKIPNAYQVVMTAINRGIPIAEVDNGKAIQRNLLDFAYKLSGKMARTMALPNTGLGAEKAADKNPADAGEKKAKGVKPQLPSIGLKSIFKKK